MSTVYETNLGYQINDADNHFNEPSDCFERYIDPKCAELSIRSVIGPDGDQIQLFAGRPSKFHSKQVTFSTEELRSMLGDTTKIGTGAGGGMVLRDEGGPDLSVVPGMLLSRLNPLKGLDEAERKAFIEEF